MAMNNSDALDAIVALMSGKPWNADTLQDIAAVLEEAGYKLANYDGPEAEA